MVGPGAGAAPAPAAGPGLRAPRRADPGHRRDPRATPRAQDHQARLPPRPDRLEQEPARRRQWVALDGPGAGRRRPLEPAPLGLPFLSRLAPSAKVDAA